MLQSSRLFKAVCIALVVLAFSSASPVFANTITVTNTADSGSGSLRGAIASASSGDTINFSLTYPATITLSSTLTINTSLTISGPGASNLAISGSNAVQVFSISGGIIATISGVTIENGNAFFGSGIFNNGTLTVTNSTLSGNNANDGGSILNNGTLTVTNSTLSGNSSFGFGGSILNNGTLTVTNSTLSGNLARGFGFGGGIFNSGTLTLTDSTLSGNSASYYGGGIWNDSGTLTLTITNSTLSGNAAQFWGGGLVNNTGTLTLTNSTLSGNSANIGGGIFSNSGGALKNTIVANSPTGRNCFGGLGSQGHNLSDDISCSSYFTQTGDLNNTPAGLDPAGLQNNGGPTQTIALLATSPAVDAIPVSPTNYCTATDGTTPIATDQRGIPRPQGPACDIGAFELFKGFLSSGSFVIGNQDAVVGNAVTFWDAQWEKDNSLSGGPAPTAFKGFADQTSTAPPACGGNWTSLPGNSSKPPDTVPPFMAVIASSSVTKSGPTITGDVPMIVIVQTNPGYGPAPGHTGTGTVVVVLCSGGVI
jgi:hypothetical protein